MTKTSWNVTLKKGEAVTTREGITVRNRGNYGITISIETEVPDDNQRTQDGTQTDVQTIRP